MKNRILKLLCFALCLVFVLSVSPSKFVRVNADTTLEEDLAKQAKLESQLKSLQAKRNQLAKDIANAKNKKASQAVIKANLETKITCLEDEIDTIERLLESYESMSEIKKTRQVSLQLQMDTNYQNFKETLRYNYMYGQHSDMELLFSANSLFDFLSNGFYSQKIFNYDQTLIDKLESDSAELKVVTAEIDKMVNETQECKAELTSTQNELTQSKNEVEALIKEIEADTKKKVAYYSEVDDQITALDEEVKELLKSIAKKKTYVGGTLLFPIPTSAYSRVSSPYGYRTHPVTGKKGSFHTGVDLPAAKNTPIYAANGGEVILAKYYGGYGNCVMIDHGGGIVTVYGHANSIAVKVGQNVKRGDTIAYVGTTGSSTGYHLHFEVRINGNTADPLKKGNGYYITLPK